MSSLSRILVVDDDPSVRAILIRSLEKANFQVRASSDGAEAQAVALDWRPHLVLLDVMLPEQSGFEVCQWFKVRPETAGVPVIFVTAATDMEQRLGGFAAGACDYIVKPFTPQEVVARVTVHVRLRQTEEQLRDKNEQLERLTDELSTLSRLDPLTRLLNRRSWDDAITREHERFVRHGHPYSVVMIDTDHFKAYNDVCGHPAGDACLQKIAGALRDTTRGVDSVGRYGGEEFVVLTPETGAEAALKLAERIRRAVWSLSWPHPRNGAVGRVTVSAGVATAQPDGSWDDVLKQADDALYVAKRAGRNMVFSGQSRLGLTRADAPPKDSPDGSEPEPLNQARVLVADDEPTNRTLCRGALQRAGYVVDEVVDGVEALEHVRRQVPDVIVMDVVMPRMDGVECTRQLRNTPETRDVPIILLSAQAKHADVLSGLEAGADEYVTKPVRATELALRVRSMVRLHRERADLLRSYTSRGEQVRMLLRLVEMCREVSLAQDLDALVQEALRAVSDITCSRRVAIMVPDDDGHMLRIVGALGMDPELADAVRVPTGAPVAGQVFVTGQSIVVNEIGELEPYGQGYDSCFFERVPLLAAPLAAAGRTVGVLSITDRYGDRGFESDELEFIELMGSIIGTALHDVNMRQVRDAAADSIMIALAKLAEHRDNDTGLHLDRVTQFCLHLADKLQHHSGYGDEITSEFLHDLQRAVPLHDIGKVAVPDQILLHPGRLNPEQMDIMRTHTVIGAATIQTLIDSAPGVTFLSMAEDIARYHHERWDGTGYPAGLSGTAIPLSARIAAVADVYDALTTKRVYKDALAPGRAAQIIRSGAGTQFDPGIVRCFNEIEPELRELVQTMRDAPVTTPLAAEADQQTNQLQLAASRVPTD